MPELPDIDAYIAALDARIVGRKFLEMRLANPFVLRTVDPPVDDCENRQVVATRRIGKRVAIGLEDEYWLVVHLMIGGRFRWYTPDDKPPARNRNTLALLDFDSGILVVTEAGSKKRASLHVVRGADALAALNPGGLEVLDCRFEDFADALLRENRTLKRALTDPRILSGIGNAYSDEILHLARLSPTTWTSRLDASERRRLFDATRQVLTEWRDTLVEEAGEKFPEKVTAFRPTMRVHGKYGEPCPECRTRIQRIRYANNETNYCPRCQTNGKLLADRALSRLLKGDWPRSIDELEKLR